MRVGYLLWVLLHVTTLILPHRELRVSPNSLSQLHASSKFYSRLIVHKASGLRPPPYII